MLVLLDTVLSGRGPHSAFTHMVLLSSKVNGSIPHTYIRRSALRMMHQEVYVPWYVVSRPFFLQQSSRQSQKLSPITAAHAQAKPMLVAPAPFGMREAQSWGGLLLGGVGGIRSKGIPGIRTYGSQRHRNLLVAGRNLLCRTKLALLLAQAA